MRAPNPREPSALPLFEGLPGIPDVVWATVARLAELPGPARVLFAAAEPRAGTTVLATATAVGLARHQRVPVGLVETNVARPALAAYLGLETRGLSDVLDGRADPEDCLQEPRGCQDLLVLTAGTPRAPRAGEFATADLAGLLARLAARCRYVLLDAAPLVQHVESRILLRHADAVLLVLRSRTTRRSDAELAHRILLESGVPVLGSIFNAHRGELRLGAGAPPERFRWQAELAARLRAAGVESARHEAPVAQAPSAASAEPVPQPAAATFELPASEPASEAHRKEVDLLKRRIAKLTRLLDQNEVELRRLAALKDVDPGLPSIYRGVQGLSPEEEAHALKRSLMQKIFQANLELNTAIARHP